MAAVKIARIITRLNVGGPAYQSLILARDLPERFETLLITGQVDFGEQQFDSLIDRYPCNIRICKNLQRRIDPIKDTLALISLVRILRKYRPDIVHTHTAKAGTLGRIAARIVGCPVIVHTFHGHVMQGYFSSLANRAIVACERKLAGLADAIVAISPRLAEQIGSYLGEAVRDKLCVVNLGVPLVGLLDVGENCLREELCLSSDAVVFGTMGRLVDVKDHDLMINAFGKMVHQLEGQDDVHLLIAGTGPLLDRLKVLAAQLNVAGRVRFLGMVEDLSKFYGAIDAGVLTSKNEGTPVMLLEAMAEFAGNRQPGLSINERSALVERFSPQRLTKDIADLYDKLLHNKGK